MITVKAAPLPSNFRGTPQELLDAFLERLEITSDDTSFVISDVEPEGNQGPWLKNGTQWWVWDETTSAYIPLDISPSASEQIFVGINEPDPDEFTIWLKISNTNEVLGLYYWFGLPTGWVTQSIGIPPNSIGELELKDNSVTRNKIKNLEVVASKIQNDLPVSKLERGTSNQFLRMKPDASAPFWSAFIAESDEVPVQVLRLIQVEHNLGATPQFVRCVLVNKETELGWEVGDEVTITQNAASTTNCINVFANDTNVGVMTGQPTIRLQHKDSPETNMTPITASKWAFKFYYAIG